MTQIHLLDDLPNAEQLTPEDKAMLQALYSRSSKSVTEHLARVGDDKGARFMQKFYVGYGHDSIGDCGEVTLFFEGVSILAAKALQDTPLYRGQETSTRYLDFHERLFRTHNNEVDEELASHHELWRGVYTRVYTDVCDQLIAEYETRPVADQPGAYEKIPDAHMRAINARAFDVARGFLPAGATTQLSWTTDLRHARDHLRRLVYHPLTEVQSLAKAAWAKLHTRYPDSFPETMWRPGDVRQSYALRLAQQFAYYVPEEPQGFPDFLTASTIDPALVEAELGELLLTRPQNAPLPYALAEYGSMNIIGLLDYGSFRDLQRHRAGMCRMPLHTNYFGMHEWYITSLPEKTRQYVLRLTQLAEEHLTKLQQERHLTPAELQYYIPMAYRTPVSLQYDLRQLVYTIELRTKEAVHPTLRAFMQRLAAELKAQMPSVTTHADMSPDTVSWRRGTQTILDKTTGQAI